MPKWLVILLAVAAVAGIVLLDQWAHTLPAITPESAPITAAPSASPPAQTPPVVVPQQPASVEPTMPSAVQTPSSAVEQPAAEGALQSPSSLLPVEVETQAEQTESASAPQESSPAEEGASQTPSSVLPTVERLAAAWAGLPLQAFLEQASGDLVRLSPETVTWLGIGPQLGMRDDHLDPLTREAEREYYDLEQAIADRLATFDLGREAAELRLYAQIYGAWLENDLTGRGFSDNVYSVSSYMDSYPTYIEWFLTSLHPLETRDNIDDYLSRLSEIPTRFRELEARLVDSEALNAVPPRFMLEKAVEQLRETGNTPVRETGFYTALEAALGATADIDAATATALLDDAASRIEKDVLPAYLELGEYVAGMASRATDDAGVWKQTNGAEYYAYCLESQTTTDMTADEVYDFGVSEVARIETEIRAACASVGIDSTASIPEIYGKLAEATGTTLGDDTIASCQKIIDDIGPRIAPAFLRMPTQKLVVVDGGYDTYFSAGTLDGSRPGQFFIPTQMPEPVYELPTVVYHEAVPGHGLQAAYAYEADLPDYIAGLSFTAFSEGWALYAERLAWEEGVYADNPYGNFGRLQDELFRASRLALDPGIHAKRWTYEQAVAYMIENTGLDEDYVRAEVERYIVSPGQAVTYKIGMREMLQLRAKAQTELGAAFSLPQFHDAVLSHGELPFSLLEQQVDEYIATARSSEPSP